MKKTEQQEQRILSLLRQEKSLTLSQGMKLLRVSESTVRRLFSRLESRGVALRRYGGIHLIENEARTTDYLYEQVEVHYPRQKERIGYKAAKLVESGDIIYIDSGTTMASFCEALSKRLSVREITDITVFTNSLVNLELLSDYVTVSLVGGEYRSNRRDFSGYLAEKVLSGLHFSKCFLGADGFHTHHGFTATDFSTAHLNELVLANTDLSFVLIDSSKFMTASMVSYSQDSHIHGVITNEMPLPSAVKRLEALNIELITC